MIKIEKMVSHHLGEVIALGLEEDQIRFVGAIDEILSTINAQIRPHVIVSEDQVVGFFLIDIVYEQSIELTTKQNVTKKNLGLRKFFIDRKHQGHGYAKQTLQALPAYLQSEFPYHTDLYLTVNCKNDAAKTLYLNNGFEDTKKLYLKGPSGPQHIMRMNLVKS